MTYDLYDFDLHNLWGYENKQNLNMKKSIFSLYIKMWPGYYKNNNNNNKKKQRKASNTKALEGYQNLYEENKNKKHDYAHKQYGNLSVEEIYKKHQYCPEQYKIFLKMKNKSRWV